MIFEAPMFVTVNDVNNAGDGGRVVLNASPSLYRALGHHGLAEQLESAGVMQVECVFVFRRDVDMAPFPFLKSVTETVGFLTRVEDGLIVTPVPVVVPLLEPPTL